MLLRWQLCVAAGDNGLLATINGAAAAMAPAMKAAAAAMAAAARCMVGQRGVVAIFIYRWR